eukprot:TRINITY_DN3641_c0_g1_i7.p2 TRINITY_DN3641_c0_g1~~TRINITY_DN3641_c0_g1_i7.p2  ORF type:complete len:100 (-),score=39.53 TRINITY_DN3641_c0_g1_i7:132-431(-)
MSWSDYCSRLVGEGKVIAHAAVFDQSNQVLGYSPSFYASIPAEAQPYDYNAEVRNVVASLGNPANAQASGIKVGGVKYMYIRSHVEEKADTPFLVGNKV